MIWEEDRKGAIWGRCTLPAPELIREMAEIVAARHGRLITASPYWQGTGLRVGPERELGPTGDTGEQEREEKLLRVAYHFDVAGVTFTCTVTLDRERRTVPSITPLLKSADWLEREMKESYQIEVQGHPNPHRLFLDESIDLPADALVPLSEAMSGTSTSTLWERVMAARGKGGEE